LPDELNKELRLIWWPRKFPPLSHKQVDIISLLVGPEGSITYLNNYKGQNREKDERYQDLWEEHVKNITEAVRAGLIWHPLISEFVYTHKALGDKEYLRNIKRGWETGVKRPIKIEDVKFMLYLDKIVEYRQAGKTWKEIRRVLMKRKIIEKMTWQALQKKVKKAWEARWAKFNKEAPPFPDSRSS